MPSKNSSRRDFLKVAGAGVTATALSASSYARVLGANERVSVGIVGFSDRCRSSLIPAFLKSSSELNFEFVALSDIWNRRRDDGAAYINKLSGKQIALARNNDELYDNKNVQAVIVATAATSSIIRMSRSTRASISSFASSGPFPPVFPISGSSIKSTLSTGFTGLPHPRSVVANGGI